MNKQPEPYVKDAEGAGRFVVACITQRHKAYRNVDAETIEWVARWAGHWGRLALDYRDRQP